MSAVARAAGSAIRDGFEDQALKLWCDLQADHPAQVGAVVGEIVALRRMGRIDEALGRSQAAMTAFPGESDLAFEHAILIRTKQDWPGLLHYSDELIERFDEPKSFLYKAVALSRAGRVDEAEAVLSAASDRFHSAELAIERARLPRMRRDYEGSLARWRQVAADYPKDATAVAGLSDALRTAGLFEEAETTLAAAEARFGGHLLIALERASLALDTGAPDAFERWRVLKERYPDAPVVQAGFGRAQMLAQFEAQAKTADDAPPETPKPAPAPQADPGVALAPAELMAQFESIGDNCEFGLTQRHFGAEPLGLLRWSSINVSELTDALNDSFAGVGEPENTDLLLLGTEYITRDKRYRMTMHTFLSAHAYDRDDLYPKLCKRLVYLRRKILEDLEEGEKIFVHKSVAPVPRERVLALGRAARARGCRKLLVVLAAPSPAEAGTVERLDPYTALGYLDRFSGTEEGWKISFDTWLQLCRAAWASFQTN